MLKRRVNTATGRDDTARTHWIGLKKLVQDAVPKQ